MAAKVGVNVRHVAAVGETAGDMAEKAAKKLLKNTLLIQRILISIALYAKF